MEITNFISTIILSMREYQKQNNIKKQCVTNTQYLHDIIKTHSNNNVKTKSVFVMSNNEEENTLIIVSGHLVIIIDDDTMIEPSYDIFCLKNKLYFDNFNDLINAFDDKNDFKLNFDIKQLIDNYIYFMKLSDRINNNEFIITSKQYYNELADYIEKIF
jgi:hypothetical protein